MARGSAGAPAFGRIVVKIGSAVIAPGGMLDSGAVARIATDIAGVLAAEPARQVVIVSSGAVASGFRSLGLTAAPKQIVGKQAAAAIGQPRLMQAWAEAFGKRSVAQVLLTAEDIDHRTRFLNARRTLETLLESGVVPIVNENDSVSFAEIKLGDNDNLSALVANLVAADLLIVLSSVAGVWDSAESAPNGAPGRTIVAEIRSLADGLRHVRASQTDVGTGGMETKIRAACTAAATGTSVVIADGSQPGIVARLVGGERVGTWFPVAGPGGAARKNWIGFSARPKGVLVVDDGARRAIIEKGASLLPSGIREVRGEFEAGTLVEIHGVGGGAFARGLASYAAEDLRALAGKKTAEIAATLGYHYADEAVHRDDLAVVDDAGAGARKAAQT